MPHSPELIELMLKEAGLFDNVKSWFSGFFAPKPPGTKEQKRARSRVESHFGSENKDWDRLVDNASRKSFAKAIASDRRADAKLKMHVDNLNRLKTGKVLGTVSGTEGSRTARRDGSQSYKIVKLRGSDRLGCSCRDWRYKKSVAQPGEQVDCKHIRQFKQMNKTAGHTFSDNGQTYDVEQLWKIDRPGQDVDPEKLLGKIGRTWGDRLNRYGWKDVLAAPDKYPDEVSRVDKADLRYPVLVRDRDDVVVDGIHRLLKARKTGQPVQGIRLSPEDMQAALLKKEAGHVEDRIAERAPGSTYEVAKIQARIPSMNLRKGQTYHVPLKGGKGYAVIGDVGKKHVVKTVLGPNMRPPGSRAKVAMAKSKISAQNMQKGDVVVMTMGPETYINDPKSSSLQKAKERVFRHMSPRMQGEYTHSGIYVGNGQIVEAREDGVTKKPLTASLRSIDGAVVVRPRASKKVRARAADFAESRVGPHTKVKHFWRVRELL